MGTASNQQNVLSMLEKTGTYRAAYGTCAVNNKSHHIIQIRLLGSWKGSGDSIATQYFLIRSIARLPNDRSFPSS
jgi:hypothetical protein